ncbi:MAG TPA: class I SAM-dependent methyltransferase, partial [Actinomycetota bacterium]|nr:class I SAM-dependent methyltransferase [Actinomycetota bacterium]
GGRGTLRLLSRGLKVTATDISQEAIDLVRSKLPPGAPVSLVCAPFQELELKLESYDVVVACYSLFFLPLGEFEAFWSRVVASVRPGGLFAGEFLGVNDSWSDRGLTLLDEPAVRRLFDSFEVLHFEEEDKDGHTSVGDDKHWHVFHVIARKV